MLRDYREGDYFAGFADGEGCFFVGVEPRKQRANVRIGFAITQRDDHVGVLTGLQHCFGGCLSPRTPDIGSPQFLWSVRAKEEVLSLIEYFDAHHLVEKQDEYVVWREAALLYYRHSVGKAGGNSKNPDWLHEAMIAYAAELSELKKYQVE